MKSIIFWLFLVLSLNTSQIFGEYENTNGKPIEKSFKDLLEWSTSDVDTKIDFIELSDDWKDLNLEAENNYAIWIGHSTFLIKKNGYTILTDPVFSERASPLKNIGPKRLIPPAIPIDSLPNIDFVTVSHNHYDHLDKTTIRELVKLQPSIKYFVPLGLADILRSWGAIDVTELDWWQPVMFRDVEIQPTPVKHWSKRTFFDRNKSLWSGWMMKWDDFCLLYTSDAADE